jgi:hypothetical protein
MLRWQVGQVKIPRIIEMDLPTPAKAIVETTATDWLETPGDGVRCAPPAGYPGPTIRLLPPGTGGECRNPPYRLRFATHPSTGYSPRASGVPRALPKG